MRFTVLAAVCVAFYCGATFAQARKLTAPLSQTEVAPAVAQAWDKEPETIFGLKLGEVLPPDALPTCPVPSYANKYEQPKVFCIDPRTGPYAEKTGTLRMLPLGEITNVAPIYFEAGRFYSLHIQATHSNYHKLRSILIERYGPPTSRETSTVQTQAGGEFSNEILSWTGKKNSIILVERFERVDSSMASISNNELIEAVSKRRQDGLRESASKM